MRKQWRNEEAYLSFSWSFQFLVFLDWCLSDNSGIHLLIDYIRWSFDLFFVANLDFLPFFKLKNCFAQIFWCQFFCPENIFANKLSLV